MLSLPLIEAAHRAFGEAIDVWSSRRTRDGNAPLVERHGLTLPMLDDSALHVSFAYDLDTVPTIILADADGDELRRFVGLRRADWQALFGELSRISGCAGARGRLVALPGDAPGLRLEVGRSGHRRAAAAEAEAARCARAGSRSRESDDVFEFMFDQGLTDGLPVMPPTPERVMRMLAGTKRDAQEVVADRAAEHGARDGREGRDQRGDGGLQAGVSAGRHRRARSGLHGRVQHARRHRDHVGRDADARRERADPRTASA